MKRIEENNKTAVKTMIDWKFNPSKIENRVDSRKFSRNERKLLREYKF